MPIAILASIDVLVFHFFGLLWAVPLLIAVLVLLFLYRDPYRKIPPSPLGVVSPVDGRVVALDTVAAPYGQQGKEMTRIAIQMSGSGIFSLRSPMEGKVIDQWFFPEGEESAEQHDPVVRYAHWVQSDEQDDLIITLGRPAIGRHPYCEIQSGERIGQGQRCGFILMGTRVELLMPLSSRLEVNLGSKVRSGSDIIATLIH